MTLLELQRDFRSHILRGDTAIEHAVPAGSRRGLRVYHHAYRATLVDCLRDTYEKTAAWLGDETFDEAAGAYVEWHPPSSWTLADYGRRFPEALATHHPDDPEIGELAWLDHALRHAFAAADPAPVDSETLARVDWDQARLRFAPHVAARTTQTNVVAIWNALAAEEMPPPCDHDVRGGVLVWRDGLSPSFRTTPPFETSALVATLAGKRFAETCALISDEHGASAEDVGGMLAGWLRDGLIVAID
jgi:hypothetical protein